MIPRNMDKLHTYKHPPQIVQTKLDVDISGLAQPTAIRWLLVVILPRQHYDQFFNF